MADGIGIITINRPEARNAVNEAVARSIAAIIDDFDSRSDITSLIITGAGGTFCAGMDLKGFPAGENSTAGGRGFGGIAQRPPAKTIIAAVEGYALAGGFEIVLSCDLIVASEEAIFGLPEVSRGLVAGAGGLFRLPRRIPYHLAMEIALTGARVPAARLHAAGLINRWCPRVRPSRRPARWPPRSGGTRRCRWPRPSRSSPSPRTGRCAEAFDRQSGIAGPVFFSADAMEGAVAFAEKRPPVWRGE